jgi:outer membrane protein TolC
MNKNKKNPRMKRVRNNGLIVFLSLMILSPRLMAQVADSAVKPQRYAFTAQEAVAYAIKNNVTVKNALVDVLLQEEQNKEITSRALPQINGNLGTTYNPSVATQVLPNFISPATYQVLIDQGVKDGSGNPIQMPNDFGFIAAQFGTKFSATAGLSLSQLLFDGQVFVGLMARDAAMQLAKKRVEVSEDSIKANIYKIYYQLVVGKTQLQLLDANITLIEKLLHDTRIIHENGFVERLDVDKVSVQLTNLQTERRKAYNSISNGYFGLKFLMGMPVTDTLELTETITDETIKAGILENTSYNYEDRSNYQYLKIAKELNEYNIRRWNLSKIPTVSLNANYAKNAQRDKWNFIGKGDWFTIATINLNISVPIFNGFYTRSKVNQAKLELQKTENYLASTRNWIDNEVANAKNNFNSAVANMEYQKKNMELAERIYQQTKKKYEIGTGSQTEINTAQVEMNRAQNNYISSLYDAIIARVDFMRATGKL